MSNISNQEVPYTLRSAAEGDFELLRQLHGTTLRPYVEKIWGWNDEQQLKLLRERFDPDKIKIIQKDRIDIGVLQVEHRSGEVFLGNVLLHPEFQNKGLGTAIVGDVINDANKMQLPVTLTVLRPNPAKALYERLGFRVTAEDSVRFFMKRESAPFQCQVSLEIRPEIFEDRIHISDLHQKAFGGNAEGTLVNQLVTSHITGPLSVPAKRTPVARVV